MKKILFIHIFRYFQKSNSEVLYFGNFFRLVAHFVNFTTLALKINEVIEMLGVGHDLRASTNCSSSSMIYLVYSPLPRTLWETCFVMYMMVSCTGDYPKAQIDNRLKV